MSKEQFQERRRFLQVSGVAAGALALYACTSEKTPLATISAAEFDPLFYTSSPFETGANLSDRSTFSASEEVVRKIASKAIDEGIKPTIIGFDLTDGKVTQPVCLVAEMYEQSTDVNKLFFATSEKGPLLVPLNETDNIRLVELKYARDGEKTLFGTFSGDKFGFEILSVEENEAYYTDPYSKNRVILSEENPASKKVLAKYIEVKPENTPEPTEEPTQEPTPEKSEEELLRERMDILSDQEWKSLGLEDEKIENWLLFKEGGEISNSSKEQLKQTVASVEEYKKLIENSIKDVTIYLSDKQNLMLKAKEVDEKIIIYGVDGRDGKLFLIKHGSEGERLGIRSSEIINGLTQEIDDTGEYVNYVTTDENNQKEVFLRADAKQYIFGSNKLYYYGKDKFISKWLESHYDKLKTFPRYLVDDSGVDILINKDLYKDPDLFFALKKVGSALEFLNDERFAGFKDFLNSEEYSEKTLIISETWYLTQNTFDKHTFCIAGFDYLKRKDENATPEPTFAYIMHEFVGHKYDGNVHCSSEAGMEEAYLHEIGNRKIPEGFEKMDSHEVIKLMTEEKKSGDVYGAHLINYWILYNLGYFEHATFYKNVIKNGWFYDENGHKVGVSACDIHK